MKIHIGLLLMVTASVASAQSQPADAMTTAQALDRCMTTYAVRLTRTDASDETIYQTAQEGCAELELALTAAVRAERSPQEADQIIAALNEQSQPNFQVLTNRIRSDRAERAAQ